MGGWSNKTSEFGLRVWLSSLSVGWLMISGSDIMKLQTVIGHAPEDIRAAFLNAIDRPHGFQAFVEIRRGVPRHRRRLYRTGAVY